ncbi:Methyltransferase type 12 [Thiocapsa sp. KS1]|nr:class I SAM-dependent methyltransferase [Thiocapsa sp. KS1]CRI67456.1 Methyltransferase type 12 [Thiocapsa sp. KS1]
MNDETLGYYRDQTKTFVFDTQTVDMTPLYAHFLPRLHATARILDAGCGSGRDARAFAERGFQVTAFDASPEMAAVAEAHSGVPVVVLRFQEIAWRQAFDGIWACASLLHVPTAELPDAMHRLGRALTPGGILYASFKYGHGEQIRNGRHFTDLDEGGLADLLKEVGSFVEIETWVTCDRRPGRESERWLNSVLRLEDDA